MADSVTRTGQGALAETVASGVDPTGQTVASGVDPTGQTLASGVDPTGQTLASDAGASGDLPRAFEVAAGAAGHYALGAEIARGGMGQIRTARDRRLGRTVAIKTLLPGASSELGDRFEREARITARLMHPAIVPVYEAGRLADGQPFYAMKWVAGRSLEQVARQARTLRERLALLPAVITVVDAIAYAHSLRVIHRDLKPHNVLVGDFGETVVIDWGLAKDLAASASEAGAPALPYRAQGVGATRVGHVMGTVPYMPPEQAAGAEVDERADVYALGALLYHVLSGAPPYQGRDSDEVLEAVLRAPPRALSDAAPGVPPALASLVRAAMAREPGDRPTARQLAEQLRRFETGQLVAVHSYSAWELVKRWLGRHRTPVLVGAVALSALLVLGLVSLRGIVRERDRARRAERSERASRVLAERERARAEAGLTALLTEQGRLALLEREPQQAAAALSAAYARGPASPGLELMLAAALAPLEAERVRLEAGGAVRRVRLTDAGPVAWRADGGIASWAAGAGGAGVPTLVRGGWAAADMLALSHDGRVVASARVGQPVMLWDARSGARLGEGAEAPASGPLVALSRDGGLVATASPLALHERGAARARWRWAVGRPPELGPALEEITELSFNADGSRLLVLDKSGVAALVDSATGRVLQRYAHGPDLLLTGAISPRGLILATAARDGSVRVWGTEQALQVATLSGHRDAVSTLAFSPDGALLATGSWDRTVRVWDAFSGALLVTLVGHDSLLADVAFNASGAQLISAARDGSVRVWDLARVLPHSVRHVATVSAATLSPDGALLATASSEDDPAGAVQLFDAVSAAPAGVLALPGGATRVRFSRDGVRLAAGGPAGRVVVWQVAGRQQVAEVVCGAAIEALAFSPDGERLGCAAGGRVQLFATADGARVLEREAPGVSVLEWTQDGARLVTAGQGVEIADGRTGVVTQRWPLPALTGPGGALAPDGAHLLLTLADKSAGVLELGTGGWRALEGAEQAFGLAAAWSPDGALVATCGFDGSARVWSAEGGPILLAPVVHGGMCAALELAAGHLVTGGSDGARLWRLPVEQRAPAEVARVVAAHVPARVLAATAGAVAGAAPVRP